MAVGDLTRFVSWMVSKLVIEKTQTDRDVFRNMLYVRHVPVFGREVRWLWG